MPPTCSICYESFTSPVSLPCGHVFCRECVRRTVDSIKSAGVEHFCPTCRASYSILNVDPALIPPYLRPHILPPLRRVFFDAPRTPRPHPVQSQSQSQPPPTPAEFGRAVAEGNALRLNCATWRRRAEVHAAANTSLLGFARAAKDCALRMRAERDAERNTCVLLKRKLAELLYVLPLPAFALRI
ncbi:hypothetical protein DFH07DRAFT_763397 [Mycena maculata]|uniref:RING-type domain-containing protein n=1 Tax=Mycena maculata TaxID=230809 RepID=A0AAD7H4S7_9AGAR|nr:hypothetical protein DFH07DRAFT_763397 [Mycena maculata]